MWINLIRHRFARNSELTTLKLFQSFATVLRKAVSALSFLPIDSTKQSFTALASQKQIDTLKKINSNFTLPHGSTNNITP
jgi:hypothetical protein